MSEYRTDFVRESDERITELNNALLTLEHDPDDETITDVFRIAHTLKGNCGAAGLERASDLAHAIEDVLDAVRSGDLEVSPELMDAIFDAVDVLEEMVAEVDRYGTVETDPAATIDGLRSHLEAASVIDPPSAAEIDDVLARTESTVDDDHDLYAVRIVPADIDERINEGRLVVEALIDAFELVGTAPPREAIEAGDYGDWFDAVFASAVSEAAIASGLEPVEEVETFELVTATDRLVDGSSTARSRQTADGPDLEPGTVPGDELDPDTARELEVDDLLSEFDELDDLDGKAEEFAGDDDLEAFDEMGDAGSFDDLLEADSSGGDHDADSAESATEPSSTVDDDHDDATTTDAGSVFEELKDEVEMVGFDELQDELADLEFDEYADEEEVSMDELLGDEADGTGPFPEDTSESDDATDDAEVGSVETGATADAESAESESLELVPAVDLDTGDDGPADATDDGIEGDASDSASAAADDRRANPDDDADPTAPSDDLVATDLDVSEAFEDDRPDARGDEPEFPDDEFDDAVPDEFGETEFSDADVTPDEAEYDTPDFELERASPDEPSFESDPDSPDTGGDTATTTSEFDREPDTSSSADEAAVRDDDDGADRTQNDERDETGGFDFGSDLEPAAETGADGQDDGSPDDDTLVRDAEPAEDSEDVLEEIEALALEDGVESPDDDAPESRADASHRAETDAPEPERVLDEPDLEIPELSLPEAVDRGESDVQTDESQSIRVDVDRIDELRTLVEGLVTTRVRLRHAADTGESIDAIEPELDDLAELTGDLQETVMDVRLVPLESVASRLPRVVRDVAREQGKAATFEMDGDDVELDRGILERLRDPLVHLVRNAVDHGIEPPDEREAAGKPREGTVGVTATRARDRVTITVSDDGSGLDPDRLRSAAVDAAVLEDGADIDDDDAYDLVFHPGFTTADEVTDVSGRGVGMDVVKRTVESLDGSVRIDSDPGEGTTVTMTLPVSIAIEEVLFVESGGQEFGVPTKVVHDVESPEKIERIDGQRVLVDDDEEYPVVRLGAELGTGGSPATEDMLLRIRDDVRPIAIRCDRVRDQQEVVVTPYDGFMSGIAGLSGATVRGRGEVVNILDVTTL